MSEVLESDLEKISFEELKDEIRGNEPDLGGKCPNPNCSNVIQKFSKPLCSNCLADVVKNNMDNYDLYLSNNQPQQNRFRRKCIARRILEKQNGRPLTPLVRK